MGSSCKPAGTCSPFRFRRSSHRVSPRSRPDACSPRPPTAQSRVKGRGPGDAGPCWQPVPWPSGLLCLTTNACPPHLLDPTSPHCFSVQDLPGTTIPPQGCSFPPTSSTQAELRHLCFAPEPSTQPSSHLPPPSLLLLAPTQAVKKLSDLLSLPKTRWHPALLRGQTGDMRDMA